jgi:hypothetical protein
MNSAFRSICAETRIVRPARRTAVANNHNPSC